MEKIVWSIDDLQVDVKQKVTEEVKQCSINYEAHLITFHRPVTIEVLRQIVHNYEDITRATSQGMRPVDDDNPPF